MFKASFYPESFKMFIERGVDLNQLDEDNCHILRQLIDDLDDHNPDLNTSFYPVLQLLAARETNGLNMLQKVRDHSRKFESIKFQPGVGTVENLAGAQYPSTPKKCFLAGTRFPSVPRIFYLAGTRYPSESTIFYLAGTRYPSVPRISYLTGTQRGYVLLRQASLCLFSK